MSFSKSDQVFPLAGGQISEVEFTKLVAEALKNDYADHFSSAKQIGRQTNTKPKTVRNWYQGRHSPSSFHLLILARSSPSILQLVLTQIGGSDLYEAFQLLWGDRLVKPISDETIQHNTDKVVSIGIVNNSNLQGLNRRQLWFHSQLKQGRIVSANAIVKQWSVKERTAWRDIKELTAKGVIAFIGTKRTGKYILC